MSSTTIHRAPAAARFLARLRTTLPPFTRGAAMLLVALSVLNGSNYLFNVAVSRLLGPGAYGELASLLAAMMVLSVPFGVIQTLAAKRAATLDAADNGEAAALAVGASKGLLPVAILATLLTLAVSPLLGAFLSTGTWTAALLAPYVGLSLLASVHLGVLQGRLRFGAFAAVTLAAVAVRLTVGVTLVWTGLGVPGAMLGTVLAVALSLCLLLPLTVRGAERRAAATIAPFRGETIGALLALGSFWLLAELDILLARHYLGSEASGYYSSAGLLARVLLFLPGALSIVALPRFAAARTDPGLALRRLRTTLWLVAALSACGYVVLVAFRHMFVGVTFGSSFASAESLLPVVALGGAALALINVLVYYHIALGTRAYLFVLGGTALEAIGIGFFHGSGKEIGLVFVLTSALVCALQLHAAYAAGRFSRRADFPKPAQLAVDAPVLSVVLPCHNGARELPALVAQIRRHLDDTSYEIVVVSDGSTDLTEQVATNLGSDVRVVHYPVRVGKGHALRVGLEQCAGRYVSFIDADGDIDPAALRPFVELMRLFEPDIVLGSKRHPLSELHYPLLRRLLSWGYQRLVRLLFRVNVRDTQTGLKLIRREVLDAVLPRMLEKRYAFDLELLVVARVLGFRRVFEAPVRIDYRFSSGVNPHATLRIFLDTLAIFYRRYVLATYGSPRSGAVTRRKPVADRLRILFLGRRDVRNPDAAGVEASTHEVARRCAEQGHSVSLLTSRFPGCRRHEIIDGVHVRRVGRLGTGTFHLLVQFRLARLRGFDVVIDEIDTIPFVTPLWRWRLPATIALTHEPGTNGEAELTRPLTAIGSRLMPRLLRLYRSTPVVAVSESRRDQLVDLGLENVHVIASGRKEPATLGVSWDETADLLGAVVMSQCADGQARGLLFPGADLRPPAVDAWLT